jgi:hypothetical protein
MGSGLNLAGAIGIRAMAATIQLFPQIGAGGLLRQLATNLQRFVVSSAPFLDSVLVAESEQTPRRARPRSNGEWTGQTSIRARSWLSFNRKVLQQFLNR